LISQNIKNLFLIIVSGILFYVDIYFIRKGYFDFNTFQGLDDFISISYIQFVSVPILIICLILIGGNLGKQLDNKNNDLFNKFSYITLFIFVSILAPVTLLFEIGKRIF
jgi:hypothetical protein